MFIDEKSVLLCNNCKKDVPYKSLSTLPKEEILKRMKPEFLTYDLDKIKVNKDYRLWIDQEHIDGVHIKLVYDIPQTEEVAVKWIVDVIDRNPSKKECLEEIFLSRDIEEEEERMKIFEIAIKQFPGYEIHHVQHGICVHRK